MDPQLALLAAAIGYFVGAISFTRVVAHFVARGADLTQTSYTLEDGGRAINVTEVNATTLSIKVSPKTGMFTALLDMLKIFIPTLAFRLLHPEQPYFLIVAAAGMVGHVWPVYYRFRGGSGISQVYGAMLAIDPLGAVVCGLAGPFLGLALHDAYTTFIGGMWLLVPWLWFRTHQWPYPVYAVFVNVIFLLASIPQIREYLRILHSGGPAPTFEQALQTTPMGKGLYKMGRKMHLIRG